MPPLKSAESLQAQCLKRAAWMVAPSLALSDRACARDMCNYINASVGISVSNGQPNGFEFEILFGSTVN